MAAKIGAVIALDGEHEFKKAVTNVNRELTNLKSQASLVKEQFAGQANSMEALRAKHEVLTKVLDTHKKKEEEIAKGLSHAKNEYDKVGKGLTDLKKRYEESKKKMDEMKSSSDASSEELKDQEKAVKELADAIKKGERNYETAENHIQDWETKMNTAQAQTVRASRAVEENAKYMKEAENATDGCATSIDEYGKKTKNASDGTKSTKEAVEALSQAIVAAGLAKGVKEIASALMECAEASGKFETGIAKVMTIADSTAMSTGEIKNAILELSSATGKSVEEISEATYQAISASVDTADAVGFVNDATKLAVGGFTDQTTAVDILTTSLNAYNLEADQTKRVSDVLVTTQNLGKTSVGNLASSMGKVIPLAAAYNMEIENLSSAYAVLTANGIKTDEATTYIKSALNELGDTGSQVGKILKQQTGKTFAELMQTGTSLGNVLQVIGDSVDGNATEFNNLWTSAEAGVGMLSIFNSGAENFNATLEKMQNSTGATETAFNTMSQTSEYAQQRMENAMNNLKVAIGDELQPAINRLRETGTDALEWATDFVKENPAIVSAIIGLVAAIATLSAGLAALYILPVIKGLFVSFNAVLMACPAVLIATAVIGLGAALLTLVGDVEEATDKLEKNNKVIQECKDNYKTLTEEIRTNRDARQDNKSSIDAEYGAYQVLANELYSLSEKENKSTGEKARMSAIVDELNSKIPELNLQIDETTGALNMEKSAIDGTIESMKNKAMAAAAQEDMNAIAKEQYELEKQRTEAVNAYNDMEKQRDELLKKSKDLQDKYSGSLSGGSKEAQDAANQFSEYNQEVTALNSQMKEQRQTIIDYNKQVYHSKQELDNAGEQVEKYADANKAAADSVEENAKAEAQAAEAIKASVEAQEKALESLQNKYEEIRDSIQQSIENKIDLFSAFDGGDKTSVDKMLENLESQLTGLQSWKSNMERLAAQVGETIGPELYNHLVELGPDAANAVQEMVNALDNGDEAKLKELSEKYAQALDFSDGAAEKLANVQAVIKTALGEMNDTSELDFSNLQKSIDSAVDNAAEGWEGLSDETRSALNQAVEAAKQSGAGIPDGLVAGIKSGEISPADAISQINSSVQAQFDFLAGMADKAGIKIPENIKAGIEAGGPDAITAIQQLKDLFLSGSMEMEQSAQETGQSTGESYAGGVEKASGAVEKAGETVSQAGTGAIAKTANQYTNTGYNLITAMAQGMYNTKEQVATAAKAAASSGASAGNAYYNSYLSMGENLMAGTVMGMLNKSASLSTIARQAVANALKAAKEEGGVKSPARKWRDQLGKNLASGMALGMQDGKQGVIDQAVGLARAALKGTTDELEIRSPSGVFKKKVGKQIAHGVAFGIKENKKAAKDEAEKLSKEIYSAATKWMSSYKKASKSHKTATMQNLENELHYWKEVKKALNEGTTAYKNAEKKITAYKKKIADKKQAIEDKKNFGVSGGSLDVYKTYYNTSAKQEVDYWKIVRKTKGLSKEQKLEADQNYLAAVEELNSQLKDLNQDYEDNVKETNDQMMESIKEVTEAYEDAVKDRKDSILSSFGLFDEFYSESESGDKLLYNLRTQVAGIADWEKELEELQSRGKLSDAVMEELKEMGPAASASIHALNDLTDAELEEYNNLYAERDELAVSQAAKDTERLRAESEAKIQQIKADAQAQIDTYKKEYDVAYAEITKSIDSSLRSLANKATTLGESATISMVKKIGETAAKKSTKQEVKKSAEKIASGFEGLPKEGKKIGRDTLQGILDGLMDGKRIKGGADDFIQSLSKEIKASAGIKSPSRLFKNEVGVQIPAGVGEGIQEGTKKATVAGTKMISDLLSQSQDKVKRQQASLANYAENLNSSARIGALNELISTPPQVSTPVNVDNSAVIAMLGQIVSVMEEYLPQVANMQMVTDTGALIGETSAGMSESFAMAVRRMRK